MTFPLSVPVVESLANKVPFESEKNSFQSVPQLQENNIPSFLQNDSFSKKIGSLFIENHKKRELSQEESLVRKKICSLIAHEENIIQEASAKISYIQNDLDYSNTNRENFQVAPQIEKDLKKSIEDNIAKFPEKERYLYISKKDSHLSQSYLLYRKKAKIECYIVAKTVLGQGSTRRAKLLTPFSLKETEENTQVLVKTSLIKEHKSNKHLINDMKKEVSISSILEQHKVERAIRLRPMWKNATNQHLSTISNYCQENTLLDFYKKYEDNRTFEREKIYLYFIAFLKQIAQMMEKMHEKQFCHLDLSLKNIFIRYSEIKKYEAIIADFGSSERIGKKVNYATTYPAPEMIQSFLKKEYLTTQESLDIWSFGIIAVLLLETTFDKEQLRPLFAFGNIIKHPEELEETILRLTQSIENDYKGPLSNMITATLSFDPIKRPSFAEIESILRQEFENRLKIYRAKK